MNIRDGAQDGTTLVTLWRMEPELEREHSQECQWYESATQKEGSYLVDASANVLNCGMKIPFHLMPELAQWNQKVSTLYDNIFRQLILIMIHCWFFSPNHI